MLGARYSDSLLICDKPSALSRIGGRACFAVVDVSSFHRAWKMGHAMSASRAPSSASRDKEMLLCTLMGRVCSMESSSVLRTASLALAMRERSSAVYVFWTYFTGFVPSRGP